MEDTPKKKSGFLRILLIMMLLAVAIVAAALAVKSGEAGGFKKLWQSITGKNTVLEIYYENASGGVFGSVGDGLAVMSESGLSVFDEQGEEVFSRLFSFGDAALWTAGKYGAACDIGGNSVIFFSADKIICELETEHAVLSVSVNSDGYMCVCTEESGYLGSVTVYNSNGTDIYKWSAGSARVLSADVKGGSELLVLTVGEGGSSLVLMPLTSEQESARYNFPGLIIDADFCGKGIAAVSTESVIYFDDKLEETAVYDFSGRYIDRYSFGDSFTALGIGDYQVGGDRYLVTVGDDGTELGSVLADGDILGMDAGKYGVAALYSGRITVYNRDMSDSEGFECAAGTEDVILRDDGSVVAAGAFSAYIHTPAED
ncbi:MAG: DUF5711 family protein [Oscillospiraceae bacterium]